MSDYKLIKTCVIIAALALSPITLYAQNSEKHTDQISLEDAHYKAAYTLIDLRQGGPKLAPALIQTMRNQLHQILQQNPDVAVVEEEYPGFIDAGINKMLPILVRHAEEGMPKLFDRQARLLVQSLTLREIQELEKIFKSPTFRRIRTASQTNTDISVVGEVVDEDRDIKTSDIRQVQLDTVQNIIPTLSDTDTAYLIKTSFNPSFKKFQKLMPKLNSIEANWSNESTPEEDAEVEEAAAKGYEEHLAKFEEEEINVEK